MRELIQAEQALGDYTRKHARHIIAGVLGNNAGTVDHATRTNFVYVRLHGDANQVVEAEAVASFPHTAGIVVAVELIKRNAASRYQVLGIASNILFVNSPWAGTVGEHAAQHQRRDLGAGGFDPLDVYNRALVNLRGRAQVAPNLTLYVDRGFYFIGGVLYEWTGGNSPAFTIPAGSFGITVRRCDLLYIGSDQALHIVQGATTSDGSVPPYPTTPYPCIPVAFVYLTSSMASIQEDNIKDARVILTASDGTPVAHNLLSAIHGDTLAAAVAAGDLIIGNDTPKWSRLAITVPAANVRNVVGVDNGETKPSWKVALDGTAAADIAGTAGAGTSLVFSHRDHVHRGIVSINKAADTTLYGAVTLSAGANITLTQVGQDIAIAAGGGAGAHDILSATHSDTLADAVVDGDVIIGNVTPKWSRLAISVPAAGVLNYLGVNNGELRPSWKSASSNPGASAAILATDSAGLLTLASLDLHRNASPLVPATPVAAPLQIVAVDGAITTITMDGFGSYTALFMRASGGTNASRTAVVNNSILGSIDWAGYNGAAYTTSRAAIDVHSTQDWAVGANGTDMWLSITPNGGAAVVRQIWIKNTGEVNLSTSLSIAASAAYTSISNAPGAAAAILATDASGLLTLGAKLTVNLNAAALPAPPAADTVLHFGNADGTVTRVLLDCFGTSPNFSFRRANNTNASPTALALNDLIVNVAAFGYHSGAAYTTGTRGGLQVYAAEAWTSTAQGTNLTLNTTATGTTTNTIRVTVSDAGSLLVGTGTDGMTAAGSLAIAQDLAHRGTLAGFYNTAPAAKPTVTGSRGANAALASLLTALAGLGLLTDSSSA